ncbi:UDP-glucose 4-epimerase GalE [Schaalia suimastitidis]|uniref:UDP-glucose 4-epimerase GalE n=1 Tax=Schaalia suimastitidis TaxID=121163 RepID=UPI00042439DC|nr:UDP-glucose 4-epimerase GalE [Schaalia suimastitidis]
MSVLVTGGAGYIGAHVVRLLRQRGDDVVVVDNLSTGRSDRIGDAKLIQLDVAKDEARMKLANVMVDEDVEAVIHFAARKQVGESVQRPAWYYQQNVGGLANVLMAMGETGVDKMIFSSSAAVYGMPTVEVVPEDAQCQPINPYGETKLIGEWMMADCERAWGLNWIGLRYFNVAGAGWVDLADPAVLNLVPMLLDRLAKGESAKIFGDDYPTPDGTCIRDYIHVLDLAQAHIAAMDALAEGTPAHRTFNVGTGQGTSVKEIVDGLRAVMGWDFPVEILGRRAGDPPKLIGDPQSIAVDLGWKANQGLEEILSSAWEAWQAGPRHIEVPGR